RDLDDLALEVLLDRLEVEDLVERVVERPQIGIDLGLEVAGQVAELLARLDRGAAEDDPADLAALERAHGHEHGEVRLARARGADREDHGVLADHLDVAPLAGRPHADALDRLGLFLLARAAAALAAAGQEEGVDRLGRHTALGADGLEHLGQDLRRRLLERGLALDLELALTRDDLDVELLAHEAEVAVAGPEQRARLVQTLELDLDQVQATSYPRRRRRATVSMRIQVMGAAVRIESARSRIPP